MERSRCYVGMDMYMRFPECKERRRSQKKSLAGRKVLTIKSRVLSGAKGGGAEGPERPLRDCKVRTRDRCFKKNKGFMYTENERK